MNDNNNTLERSTSGRKTNKTKLPPLVTVAITVFLLAAIITVVILFLRKNSGDNNITTTPNFHSNSLTDEEKQITAKVMDDYAEVTVDGYREVEDELGVHKAVIVNVKNISDETVSLAINIVAKDSDGNILDKSSLYAEGISPGQTQTFNTFVYSDLTSDELKSAKFEVYKAYTYETPTPNTNPTETVETPTEETPETVEVDTGETEVPEETEEPEETE